MSPLKKYIVRTSTDYDLEIEAESEEDAKEKASHIEFSEWGQCQSPYEVEESNG